MSSFGDPVGRALLERLRVEAAREQGSLNPGFPVTIPQYIAASINLEGTIKVQTEDDL